MFSKLTLAAALGAGMVAAQRPANMSICDYYTTALLKNNTAANQYTLLTLVVNTAVIGNYTQPNVGIAVPGILAAGEYNGTSVNLLPYFDGGFASTNSPGALVGQSVNFLDGGGAAPLMNNTPANDNTSNQYFLITHLYEYFGTLLGCSTQGAAAFPAYMGSGSQYNVHKFMDLSHAEVSYFIQQVGLAAASFGVTSDDVAAVGMALDSTFNYRCAAPAVVVPSQPAALQSICIAEDCPIAMNSTCATYQNVTMPSVAVSSLVPSSVMATGTATPAASASKTVGAGSSGTSTGSPLASASTAAGVQVGMSFAAVVGGIAAFVL